MRPTIKDVRFMRLYTHQLPYDFKCAVYYASGRVVEYKGRIPAPVARHLRENCKVIALDNWTHNLLVVWNCVK